MPESQRSLFRVRDARPAELDDISMVITAAYQEYAAFFEPAAWDTYAQNIADVRSRLAESDLIVAEQDGRILGAVTFYPDGSRAQHETWPAGWAGIRLLAVHPSSRGRGIGRALMAECLQRCRKRGVATVGLHTTEVMAVARKMYERMGFVRAPEFDFHPASGAVVMAYRFDL